MLQQEVLIEYFNYAPKKDLLRFLIIIAEIIVSEEIFHR